MPPEIAGGTEKGHAPPSRGNLSARDDPRRPRREPDAPRSRQTRGYSTQTKALVDRVSVMLFGIGWSAALVFHAPSLLANDLHLAAPIGLLAGYLLADFLAGAVHWLADRYFDPSTPILGPVLIAPFREHHVDPESIGRHDFFEVSGNNALVTTPLVLALFALPPAHDFASSLACVFGLSLTLALVATNQFHGWAHAAQPPRLARLLHATGLILTPERHALHHRAGFDRAYCVTSGWLNPIFDRLRFFDRLEGVIAAVFGESEAPPDRRASDSDQPFAARLPTSTRRGQHKHG